MLKEKQITIVSGVLIKNNQVLLCQRFEEECPDAHLKWEIPGGKIEFNETAEEALVREFKEEVGMTVKINKLLPNVYTTYWKYAWGKQQTIVLCYLVEFVRQIKVRKDHHINQIKWFDLREIDKLKTVGATIPLIKLAISCGTKVQC